MISFSNHSSSSTIPKLEPTVTKHDMIQPLIKTTGFPMSFRPSTSTTIDSITSNKTSLTSTFRKFVTDNQNLFISPNSNSFKVIYLDIFSSDKNVNEFLMKKNYEENHNFLISQRLNSFSIELIIFIIAITIICLSIIFSFCALELKKNKSKINNLV